MRWLRLTLAGTLALIADQWAPGLAPFIICALAGLYEALLREYEDRIDHATAVANAACEGIMRMGERT